MSDAKRRQWAWSLGEAQFQSGRIPPAFAVGAPAHPFIPALFLGGVSFTDEMAPRAYARISVEKRRGVLGPQDA
jgi:hypothetical protein